MKPLLFPGHPVYWFETLRSMSHIAYGAADFGEVMATAKCIVGGDPDSWHDAWRATADRLGADADRAHVAGHLVSARDAYLRAWNGYRSAEFFLHGRPDDPRIIDNYDRAVAAFASYAALAGTDVLRPVRIPFEGGELPGYFYPSPLSARRPLLLMHSGFDGSAEELHVDGALAAQERGYHVLTFDGPGQPGTRHRHGLLFRPDWEVVVGAVLDWVGGHAAVDPGRIALLGRSLGGLLCLRAAAFEPRLAAVIAVDGVYDFGAPFAAAVDPDRVTAEALLRAGSAPELDQGLARLIAADSTAAWVFGNGRYVMGGATPREFAARALDYHLRGGVAEAIRCPTLVCEAANDGFFAGQPQQVYEHLAVADKTLMRFTAEQGADEHCHAGAQRHALARICDWLDERLDPREETAARPIRGASGAPPAAVAPAASGKPAEGRRRSRGPGVLDLLPWAILLALPSRLLRWSAPAALVVAVCQVAQQLRRGRQADTLLLEFSSTLFQAVFCVAVFMVQPPVLHRWVAAATYAWFALTAWATLAIGRPFTLEIAAQQLGRGRLRDELIVRTHRMISLAWAGAFSLLGAALAARRVAGLGTGPRVAAQVAILGVAALCTVRVIKAARIRRAVAVG